MNNTEEIVAKIAERFPGARSDDWGIWVPLPEGYRYTSYLLMNVRGKTAEECVARIRADLEEDRRRAA